jgi:hypothetical protein
MAASRLRLRTLATALLCGMLACANVSARSRTAGDAVDSGGGEAHRFVLIGHGAGKVEDEKSFRRTIALADGEQTAFLVVTGLKGEKESCSDRLYQRRRELLDGAHRPVIVVLAGSDWTACLNSAGRSDAIERLSRLRELLYGSPDALGTGKLALTRQSSSPRFRSYAENAHWSVGKVLYATLNLPADNNHYLTEAGRNSEYEDRLVANRFWLNRLFTIARRDKFEAIVLFSDGDLKPLSQPTGLRALLERAVPGESLPDGANDGFAAMRRQVLSLAQKFSGKVLLVDSAPLAPGAKPAIEWRGNLGHLSTGQQALVVDVEPATRHVFTVRAAPSAGAH